MQRLLLTVVGVIASLVFAMVLLRYSKKAIARSMSRRHILHMLKTRSMSGTEVATAAKDCRSELISTKIIPVMLVKLQEEGMIQRASNNKYIITTNGLESLKGLDSMNGEFQKIAGIVEKTSVFGKFVLAEVMESVLLKKNASVGCQCGETDAVLPESRAEKH